MGGRILWEQAKTDVFGICDMCSFDTTWTVDKGSEMLAVVRFCELL